MFLADRRTDGQTDRQTDRYDEANSPPFPIFRTLLNVCLGEIDCKVFRYSMVRLQHRILVGLNVLQYFTTREWKFQCSKFLALRTQLTPEDNKTFFMNCEDVDDKDFILNAVLGARQYCLKEPLSSLPRCRRNIKM